LHAAKEVEVPSSGRRKATREKMASHRARLRAQGLRPIQIWVPDTRSPAFAQAARRQARAIARSRQEAADQAFVDAISLPGNA
jgi:hypothetical protein